MYVKAHEAVAAGDASCAVLIVFVGLHNHHSNAEKEETFIPRMLEFMNSAEVARVKEEQRLARSA